MSSEENLSNRSLVPSTTRELVTRSSSLAKRGLALAESELNRQEAEVYFNRGKKNANLATATREKHQEAIQDFTKAIHLNPKYVEAYQSRAISYMVLEKAKKAIQDCTKAIHLNPQDSFSYILRALIYRESGRHLRAIQDFTQGIEVDSKAPITIEGYLGRAGAYYRLGKYQEAIQDYSRAIEINPKYKSALPYRERGDVHLALGNYQEAIQDYSQRIKFEPKDHAAQLWLAVLIHYAPSKD